MSIVLIIWKNLKNITNLDNAIENLLYKLSEEKEIINNDNIAVNLNLLLHELQEKKILLILDNIENSFEENCKTFLTLLASNNLAKSKIILTCRERPDLFRLNTERSYSLKIEWLDYESCNKIVFKYGIFSEKELLRKFIYKLGGNPQLINMVSHTIKKVFIGNLSNFMNVNSNLTSDIYNFFDEQFENMSEIEKSILFTLNISKRGKSLEEIFEIIAFINKIELTNTIEVLIDKAFIFTLDKVIHIQSIVAEYFTKKINILVSNEILTNKPEILKKYFLVSTNEDNELFELQKACFIKEILRLLLNTLVSLENLALKIQEIILIRNTFTIEEQYILNANLIQLIINSDLKLKAFNFNNTYLKNLQLKNVDLKEVDFSSSHFDEDIFFYELGMTSSYDLDNKEPIVIFNIKNELYKYHLENNALEKIKGLNAHKEIKVLKISKDSSLIAFITIDKELFVFNQIEKKYLLNAKILNLDASKIFFSDENEHLFIYNYEGIEIYSLKLKKAVMYIQEPTFKLCYDLKLLDSLGILVLIKNDLNTYYVNIKYNKELNIIKTNIDTALFIEYHIDKKEFSTINSNKELCLYDKQFNFISKKPLVIDKNEAIKDFFLDSISNKIFIFGSKIWIFCYENFSLLNIIDTNIKNLQTSTFYSHKNYLALCYYDFSIDIFDLNTGKKVKNVKGLSQTSVSLEKNTSYLYLYLFNDSKIAKYSLKEMKVASFIDIKYSTITASCNSKNTLLALYNIEKNITLFDLIKNKIAKTIPINDKNTFCLALTQDASILAYKDGNKLIFIDTIDYTILSMLETNSLHYTKAFKFSLCNNLFICLDNEKELLITGIKTFSTYKITLPYQILDFICIYDTLYCISNNNFFIINMKTLTSITYLQTNEKLKGISYSNNFSNIFISSETTIYIFNIENNEVINEIEPKEYLYAIQAIDNILFGITINGYLDYFDIYTGSFIKRDIIPRVYENLNIKNTTGLSKAKKEVLASLGSII